MDPAWRALDPGSTTAPPGSALFLFRVPAGRPPGVSGRTGARWRVAIRHAVGRGHPPDDRLLPGSMPGGRAIALGGAGGWETLERDDLISLEPEGSISPSLRWCATLRARCDLRTPRGVLPPALATNRRGARSPRAAGAASTHGYHLRGPSATQTDSGWSLDPYRRFPSHHGPSSLLGDAPVPPESATGASGASAGHRSTRASLRPHPAKEDSAIRRTISARRW